MHNEHSYAVHQTMVKLVYRCKMTDVEELDLKMDCRTAVVLMADQSPG